jgi:hypothetical protein
MFIGRRKYTASIKEDITTRTVSDKMKALFNDCGTGAGKW